MKCLAVKKLVSMIQVNGVHLFASVRYSWAGLKACFRDETAFRQELCVGIVHFALLFSLPLATSVRVYLTILYVMILTVELLNTAVEAVVDCTVREKRPLAKKAKDCASAAVFCVIAAFTVSWAVIVIEFFC